MNSIQQATPRLLLPVALAITVLRGSTLPWVTIRSFNGNERSFNLVDIKGGIAIVVTISFVVTIGIIVGVFRRLTGMTIMSIGVAALGWMAAISGLLLTLLWSLIPSVNVAGLDLARATLSQGNGVVVTVISSLALAFMVVRHLDPFRSYAPSTHIAALPIFALTSVVLMAVNMHSEWLTLGSDESSVQALVAGDSLYGSGLVVLGLWLCVGLWVGALMIDRPLLIMFASGLTFFVSLGVVLYAIFLWAGGKALDWLVPAKLGSWSTVEVEPQLFIVLFSASAGAVISILGFIKRTQKIKFSFGNQVRSNSGLWFSDIFGSVLLVIVVGSVIWELI